MAEFDFGAASNREEKKRKKAERRDHDAYMSPPSLVESIVARVKQYCAGPSMILEPSCGDGEFVAAIMKAWPMAKVGAIDIRPEVASKIKALGAGFACHDFLKIPTAAISQIDLILTNPPFALFVEFVDHCLKGMSDGATLAFVARYGHLVGSREAQEWWRTPMENGLTPNRQIIDTPPIFPRPSFTEDGKTDSQEYTLLIMRNGFDNGGQYDPITWNKPEPRRGRKPRAQSDNGGDLFGGQS